MLFDLENTILYLQIITCFQTIVMVMFLVKKKKKEEVIPKNQVHQPQFHLAAIYFIVIIADKQQLSI